jgi:hypothetical protein
MRSSVCDVATANVLQPARLAEVNPAGESSITRPVAGNECLKHYLKMSLYICMGQHRTFVRNEGRDLVYKLSLPRSKNEMDEKIEGDL